MLRLTREIIELFIEVDGDDDMACRLGLHPGNPICVSHQFRALRQLLIEIAGAKSGLINEALADEVRIRAISMLGSEDLYLKIRNMC